MKTIQCTITAAALLIAIGQTSPLAKSTDELPSDGGVYMQANIAPLSNLAQQLRSKRRAERDDSCGFGCWIKHGPAPKFRDDSDLTGLQAKRSGWFRTGAAPKRSDWLGSAEAVKFTDDLDDDSLLGIKRAGWFKTGASPKFLDDSDDSLLGLEVKRAGWFKTGASPKLVEDDLEDYLTPKRAGWFKTGASPKRLTSGDVTKRSGWFRTIAAPKLIDDEELSGSERLLLKRRSKRSGWFKTGAAPKFYDDRSVEEMLGLMAAARGDEMGGRRKRSGWFKTGAAPKFTDDESYDFDGFERARDYVRESQIENQLAGLVAKRSHPSEYRCILMNFRVFCGNYPVRSGATDPSLATTIERFRRRATPVKRCYRVDGNLYCYTAPDAVQTHPEGGVQDETFVINDEAVNSAHLSQKELDDLVNSGRVHRVPYADASDLRERLAATQSGRKELVDEIVREAGAMADEIIAARNQRKAGKIMRARLNQLLVNSQKHAEDAAAAAAATTTTPSQRTTAEQ